MRYGPLRACCNPRSGMRSSHAVHAGRFFDRRRSFCRHERARSVRPARFRPVQAISIRRRPAQLCALSDAGADGGRPLHQPRTRVRVWQSPLSQLQSRVHMPKHFVGRPMDHVVGPSRSMRSANDRRRLSRDATNARPGFMHGRQQLAGLRLWRRILFVLHTARRKSVLGVRHERSRSLPAAHQARLSMPRRVQRDDGHVLDRLRRKCEHPVHRLMGDSPILPYRGSRSGLGADPRLIQVGARSRLRVVQP